MMYNTPGYKNDSGKIRMDLLPPDSLQEIAKVFTNGSEKYEVGNWEKGMNWSRIYAATQRHLNAFWSGEDIDSEWNLHHLAHAGCNILMLLSLYIREKGIDDRIYNDKDQPTRTERMLNTKDEYKHYTEFFIEVDKRNNLVIIYKDNNRFKYTIYYDIPMSINDIKEVINNSEYKVKDCYTNDELTFGEVADIITNLILIEKKNVVIKTISDDDDTYTIKLFDNSFSKSGYYYDVTSNKTGEKIIDPFIRHENPLNIDQIKKYKYHNTAKKLLGKVSNEVKKDTYKIVDRFFINVNDIGNLVIVYKDIPSNTFKYRIYNNINSNRDIDDIIADSKSKYYTYESKNSRLCSVDELAFLINDEYTDVIVIARDEDNNNIKIKFKYNSNYFAYEMIDDKGNNLINPSHKYLESLNLDELRAMANKYNSKKNYSDKVFKPSINNTERDNVLSNRKFKKYVNELIDSIKPNKETDKDEKDDHFFSVNLKDGKHNSTVDNVGLSNHNLNNKIIPGKPKNSNKIISNKDNIKIITIDGKDKKYVFEVMSEVKGDFNVYKFRCREIPSFSMTFSTNRKLNDERLKELIISELS